MRRPAFGGILLLIAASSLARPANQRRRTNQTGPCPPTSVTRKLLANRRRFELPSRRDIQAPAWLGAEQLPLGRLLQPQKIANYTIAFTSYAAGEPYLSTQRLHMQTARDVGGIDVSYPWNRTALMQTEWGKTVLAKFYAVYKKHARWVWKPYVIWHSLQRVRDGDFVVYLDASRFFKKGFEHSVVPLTNFLYANRRGAVDLTRLSFGMVPGLRLKERNRSGWFWPYKCQLCELLVVMGLCESAADDVCCLSYWNAPHVQASFSIWQKSRLTMQFVEAWLRNCEDEQVLRRSKQGDQCVSTLVSIAFSRALGLRVPWINLPNIQNGNKLKDPNLLFGRFARAELPPFLGASDPYPECVSGLADSFFMCEENPPQR